MRFTASLSRSLLLVSVLLVAPVLGQNATTSEPSQPEPSLAPSGETNVTVAPDVNSTAETLAPTPVPQMNATLPPVVKPSCYDNTTLLREHLTAKNTFTPEVYELCSNTVFEVGVVSEPGELCCLDGQAPLHPRSNAKIQCGPDGSSDNNCTFVGGTFQVLNVYTVFFDQPENAVLEGITFKGSVMSSALLINGGTVTFRDCIFEGHLNDGVIASFHTGPALGPTSRKLMESMSGLSLEERVNWNIVEYSKLLRGEESAVDLPPVPLDSGNDESGEERELQTGVEWKVQQYVFENCLFQHNEQGEAGESTKYGMITADLGYDIGTFENCTFFNNSYGDTDDGRGYAISYALGSKLSMINNCFIDNNFIGEGVVLLADDADLEESSGNYGSEDDLLSCQYVHIVKGDAYECIEFEATTCALGSDDPVDIPVDIPPEKVSRAPPMFSLLAVLVSLLFVV